MIKIIIAIAQRTLIMAVACCSFFLVSSGAFLRSCGGHAKQGDYSEGKGTEESIVFPFVIHMKTSKIVYDAPTLAVFHRGDWTLHRDPGSRYY
jgi:hypothetical protein